MPSGWLYATYHLSGEPRTTIEFLDESPLELDQTKPKEQGRLPPIPISKVALEYMGVEPKIGGIFPPKMDGFISCKTLLKWMILGGKHPLFLGVPLFLETPTWINL